MARQQKIELMIDELNKSIQLEASKQEELSKTLATIEKNLANQTTTVQTTQTSTQPARQTPRPSAPTPPAPRPAPVTRAS